MRNASVAGQNCPNPGLNSHLTTPFFERIDDTPFAAVAGEVASDARAT
jgi:hypothetical protein